MKTFNKILFPTDFSEPTSKLIPYVQTMVSSFNSALHVIYVCRTCENLKSIYVPSPSIKTIENEIISGAHKKMNEFCLAYFKEIPGLTSVVKVGDTTDEILQYIDSEKIDLVIVGTHGRKGIEGFIFGSVAKNVFQRATIPVMIINPHQLSDR